MLKQIKDELENLIQLPAEIDKERPEVAVDFVRDEQVNDFEAHAKGVAITRLLKQHRQQVAYQALRHTYIDTNDQGKRSEIEYFFSKKPDYKEANRLLKKMRDGLTPEQIPVWREQMQKIIRIMHPSLKIELDGDERMTAWFISLLVSDPVMGLPIGERGTVAAQVREAVADIAPGYA